MYLQGGGYHMNGSIYIVEIKNKKEELILFYAI